MRVQILLVLLCQVQDLFQGRTGQPMSLTVADPQQLELANGLRLETDTGFLRCCC